MRQKHSKKILKKNQEKLMKHKNGIKLSKEKYGNSLILPNINKSRMVYDKMRISFNKK